MPAPGRVLLALLAAAQVLTCTVAGAAVATASRPHVTASRATPVASTRPTPGPLAPRLSSPENKRARKVSAVGTVAPRTKPQQRPAFTAVRRTATPAGPTPRVRRSIRVVAAHAQVAPPGPQELLNQAVARIPGHADPKVKWILTTAYGHWGTADWYRNVVYISPKVPARRMYDVVIHEYSHLMSVAAYGANVDVAVAAMNGFFGGSGLAGAERAADCMALLQGATWTHYTSCDDAHWRDGARALLRGQRL